MVLSETRGLSLHGVIRGGLRVGEETEPRLTGDPPNGYWETHPRTRASAEPRTTARPARLALRLAPADAQTAGAFKCWALKRSPFFQRVKVMAAILRARVRRTNSGFIPWATRLV
jgi:hypothetical protein